MCRGAVPVPLSVVLSLSNFSTCYHCVLFSISSLLLSLSQLLRNRLFVCVKSYKSTSYSSFDNSSCESEEDEEEE